MATDDLNLSSMPGRYAGALFELAQGAGKVADVESDLTGFQTLLDDSAELRSFVGSPVFTAEDQSKAIAAISQKAGLSDLTANFLGVVAKNRRLFAIPQMIKAFKALAADARGEVTAHVTSAQALTDDQIEALKTALKNSVGKDVQLDIWIDPSILGGLIVKIGSRMVDTSLRTRLSAIRSGLKGAA